MVAIDNLLTVAGVAKAHVGAPVLTDVDLTVRRGEIIGIVGANGVGKSTLMSILAGDYPAEAGEIVLNGRPYAPLSREDGRVAGVGLVRQHLVVEPGQTVAHALFRHTALAGRDDEELGRRAGRLLRSVGLDIAPETLMGDLLHTQQAIVEAVRMLAEDAQLVIMDEVGASFNADEIADLHFVVRRLTQQGRSIVYISHRLHEVVNLVDRIAVLRDGVITVELKPHRVTLEDLAAELLSYEPGDPPDRTGHVGEDVAVEVAGLSTDALSAVAFTLQRGEVLGLVGPRTGGMRDVVYALAGEIPAQFETLRINGTDRTIASREDAEGLRILYLGEDARSLGIDLDARVSDVLGELDAEQLGITTAPDAPASSLSGGQLRRIALQRWVDSDADLVLLVQPTRGLDVTSRPLVFEQLAAHTSAGHSAIVVSTEADELRGWCDRIAIMRDGRIVDIVASERLDDALLHRLMSERQGDVVIPDAPVAQPADFGGWDDEPGAAVPEPTGFDGWGGEPAEGQQPSEETAGPALESPPTVTGSPAPAAAPGGAARSQVLLHAAGSPGSPGSPVSPESPLAGESPTSPEAAGSSASAPSPEAASSPDSPLSPDSPASPTSASAPATVGSAASPGVVGSAASPGVVGSAAAAGGSAVAPAVTADSAAATASAGSAGSPATPTRGATPAGVASYDPGQPQQPWHSQQPPQRAWQPQEPRQNHDPWQTQQRWQPQPQQPQQPQQPWQPVSPPAQPAPAPWRPPPTASAGPASAPNPAERPAPSPDQPAPGHEANRGYGPAPSPATWSPQVPEPWGQPASTPWQPAEPAVPTDQPAAIDPPAPNPQPVPWSSPTPPPTAPGQPPDASPTTAAQDELGEPTPEPHQRRGFWGWGRRNRGN